MSEGNTPTYVYSFQTQVSLKGPPSLLGFADECPSPGRFHLSKHVQSLCLLPFCSFWSTHSFSWEALGARSFLVLFRFLPDGCHHWYKVKHREDIFPKVRGNISMLSFLHTYRLCIASLYVLTQRPSSSQDTSSGPLVVRTRAD